MQTPTLSPYTFRTGTLDDVQEVHGFLVMCDVHARRYWAGSLDDTRREFHDPDINPTTDLLLAYTPENQLAGIIWAFARPTEKRVFLWPDIHPQHQHTALADTLMQWGLARSRQILDAMHASPRIVSCASPGDEEYRVKLLQRHGLQPVRYFFRMRRDLSQPIGPVELPAGLRMVSMLPELDAQAHATFNESFLDHWDFTPASADEWQRYMIQRDSFRRDLSLLVLDGDEVAAISINNYSPEENERSGVDEAWIGDLGVRRAWRKQGVATALLNRSMQLFKAAGIAYASLGVDSENPSGALGLYQRLGFKTTRQSVVLRINLQREKPVSRKGAKAQSLKEAKR